MNHPFLLLGIAILFTVTAQLLLKRGMLLVGKLEFSLSNLLGLISQVFQSPYLFGGMRWTGISGNISGN
ncbi:MAG: hypothetical protein C0412_09815 [Flavobacterium sp.]|nr:hypothetical protein [Flavobacterium sp.]